MYGQLTQLGIIDPTSAQLVATHSPRLRAWLDRVEDLSGHASSEWIEPTLIAEHLGELLSEIGRVYAPFLKANAQAFAEGKSEFETEIDQLRWVQPVFPYQVKCLEVLQEARLRMTTAACVELDKVLNGTGCEVLFDRLGR